MRGPGEYLFFTGLISAGIGIILLVIVPNKQHHWWMWVLTILGIIVLFLGGMLWWSEFAVEKVGPLVGQFLESGGETKETGTNLKPFEEGAGEAEAGGLGELAELAVL